MQVQKKTNLNNLGHNIGKILEENCKKILKKTQEFKTKIRRKNTGDFMEEYVNLSLT
jgi:hypothetical protein